MIKALKRTQRDAIEQSIIELYRDRLRHEECPLTSDDLEQLFIRKEHRHMSREFRNLYPWTNSYYQSLRNPIIYRGGKRHVEITIDANRIALAFPVYEGSSYSSRDMAVVEDVPDDVLARYNSYTSWLLDTFEEYNLVYRVMDKLDEICASPSQMKFIWPGLEILTQHSAKRDAKSSLAKIINANSKVPMPRISTALREACRNSSATLTVLQMMGEPPIVLSQPPIIVSVTGAVNTMRNNQNSLD
jgi:hypothetical protein